MRTNESPRNGGVIGFGKERREAPSQIETQRSGFDLERRSDGVSEFSHLYGNERYEIRSDEGQAIKSARGMPWHQEPKKVVTSCDKPGGAAHKRYIPGSPNGETRQSNTLSACVESNRRTRGTA